LHFHPNFNSFQNILPFVWCCGGITQHLQRQIVCEDTVPPTIVCKRILCVQSWTNSPIRKLETFQKRQAQARMFPPEAWLVLYPLAETWCPILLPGDL
jgi:hypothetical protein